MNERIENCLSKEIAHIFSVLPGVVWPNNMTDYDERVRKVKIDLRSDKGKQYLDLLHDIVYDKEYDYGVFHKYYVRGIWELLKQALKHKILSGPINTIPKVDHSNDNVNIFTLEDNHDSLDRLECWNKTNLRYYNVLKYGIDRIQQDLRKYYPNGTVTISMEYYERDFMRDPYIYRGVKYMIFWPLMPTILLWNGYEGIRNPNSTL